MLEEFACEAISVANLSPPNPKPRGVNPGINVVAVLVSGGSQPVDTNAILFNSRSSSMRCGTCNGKKTVPCKPCNGKGVDQHEFLGGGTCKYCNGGGKVQCPTCKGKGIM